MDDSLSGGHPTACWLPPSGCWCLPIVYSSSCLYPYSENRMHDDSRACSVLTPHRLTEKQIKSTNDALDCLAFHTAPYSYLTLQPCVLGLETYFMWPTFDNTILFHHWLLWYAPDGDYFLCMRVLRGVIHYLPRERSSMHPFSWKWKHTMSIHQ